MRRRFSTILLTAVTLAAFVAVGYAFTRAAGNWRAYRAGIAADPDPSGAEVWAGAGTLALAIGVVCARLARR